MKTKKRSSASSGRFSRGVKVGSKSRRSSRKSGASSRRNIRKEGFVSKLEDLTPL